MSNPKEVLLEMLSFLDQGYALVVADSVLGQVIVATGNKALGVPTESIREELDEELQG